MQNTTETIVPVTAKKPIILGKFPGAFGNFQAAAFTDLKAAGFDARLAHKIALDYGSDIGNAMRNGTSKGNDFGTKIAKAKQSGDARVTIGGRGDTQMSNTMALLRVVQVTSSLCLNEKLITSYEINRDTLKSEVKIYLKECEETIADWTWEA